MTVDERDLDDLLRSTLQAWADDVRVAPSEWQAPAAADRRRNVRRWATRLGPVLVAAAVVVVLVARADDEPDATIVTAPEQVIRDEIRVGSALGVRVLALADDAVYVASENDRRLYRIDRASNEVLDGASLAVPDAVAVAEGAVVAVIDEPLRLARLDPATLAVLDAVPLEGELRGMQVVGEWVWVLDVEGTVHTYATADLTPGGALDGPLPPGLQSVGDDVWRTDLENRSVLRLDADTGAVLARIAIDGEPRGIVVGDDAVWVADVENDRVVRLDPDTGATEATIDVGRFPHGLALGDGRLWVTNFEDGTLTTIDTDAEVVLTTVPIGVRPGGVLVDGNELWVAIHQEGVVRVVDAQALEARSIRPINERERDVDVGGRSIFVRCMGDASRGAPTILIEAAAGQWSAHGLWVQYGLQTTHRVCAYDRAGLGRSDPTADPVSAQRVVDDLSLALEAADISGPYVVVGHLHGGLYARLFAAQHREEVRGLVLVDSLTTTYLDELRPLLDAEDLQAFDAGQQEPEFAVSDRTASQVDGARPLGGLPLVVVSGDRGPDLQEPGLAELWRRHQRSLLTLSSDSRQILVRDAGGFLLVDAPQVVVEAVRSMAGS